MKKLLKEVLRRAGYACFNIKFLPWGINLESDLKRIGFQLTRANVILDIGANDGRWLESMYNVFPNATFYAFEPVPATFGNLRAKVGKKPRVRIYNQGLSSDSAGLTMQLYENPTVSTMNTTQRQVGHIPTKTITVQCHTLDQWLKDMAIDKIDFVKIDVEGHELQVLSGGVNAFREAKAAFLLIEAKAVLASEVSGPGVSLDQLSGFLGPFGYRLMVLYTDKIHLPEQRYYTNFNALFASVRA
jgi:FkbM family methyltransferase